MISNKNCLLDIKIGDICKNEYSYFLNKENVVGVALGYKITKGFCTFRKCITVFVKKKLSFNDLSYNNIIPKFFKYIETDVVESGIFKFTSLKSRVRPVISGYSIGNIVSNEVGSCGCLVYDKYLYILSSNHVIANNTAPLETVIIQPSKHDGGTIKKDVIGHLARYIPIKYIEGSSMPENEVDCALCKVINRSFVSPNIAFVGIPREVGKARLYEGVQKVGRTTELTLGKITNLYGSIIVQNSEGKDAFFINQIFTTEMSSKGDSGSLLLTKNNYGIGLLMGGCRGKSIYNSLDDILDALKVKLKTS